MTSKQEKLAAARKRLKEFQGKNKEVEISKQKNINEISLSTISKDNFNSNESFIRSSPLVSGSENLKNCQSGIQPHQVMQFISREITEGNDSQRKTPASSSNEGNFLEVHPEYNNINQNLVSDYKGKTQDGEDSENSVFDCANGPDLADSVEKNSSDVRICPNASSEGKDLVLLERDCADRGRSFHGNSDSHSTWIEAKKFFDYDVSDKSALNETIISLQKELQSHAQTMAILIQERNDAQIALTKVQSLLSKKSEEAEGLGQQVAHLTSSLSNLTHRLFEAEAVIKKLNLEKEENVHKWNECQSLADKFQTQLDAKEEEFKEMKRKYEGKSKDCQELLISLQEAQAQLSVHQIQLQQYSNEGHSGPVLQIADLQSENISLKKKVEQLERKLEADNAEKEESSQKFHIYAQQCNSQLNSLISQLKSLKLEKENLSKENNILSKNISELENAREKIPPSKSYETEISDLHDQLSALSEENTRLSSDLKKQEEARAHMESQLEEKDVELSKLSGVVKELSEENERLANEAETPKANERLLATMESDKIAAAKAVSQNQKLKKQVIELEQAFIRLSEEKLELTNQLAHERHVNGELQNMLRNAEGESHDDHHHHHHDHHECHHEDEEEPEPLVNDSNEIQELRIIVRQLQDDKMELTNRLNAYESSKRSEVKDTGKGDEEREEDCEGREGEENGPQCENTKLLLQQMKEKVRKTMNEIAILDEEKEKLEHLVLQLQGETETIGEYITLYQKQRMLLRQRAQEKDSQLLQLSRDKEELKSKLAALDELVQRLLAERENVSIPSGSKPPDLSSSAQIPENTAGKIRALINEIGSTTLINNQSIAFEHCSCCSGRLITI